MKRVAAAPATDSNGDAVSLRSAWDQWQTDGRAFWQQMDALVETLDALEPSQVIGALMPITPNKWRVN